MKTAKQVDRAEFTAGYRHVSPLVESYRPADIAEFERTAALFERGSLREAMHTDDLPILLAGSADLVIANAFGEIAQPWRACFTTGPINNFRPINLHAGLYVEVDDEKGNATQSGRYPVIPENGQYSEARVGEYYNTIQLATYGAAFAYSREMLANDDQGLLRDLPTWAGQNMANTLNYDVAQVLQAGATTSVSGVTMADGYNLFGTSNHGNMSSGAYPLSAANVRTMVGNFGDVEDPAGVTNNRRGIRPRYLIVPPALEFTAMEITSDAARITGSTTTTTSENILNFLTPVVMPELSHDDDWYLAADPTRVRTVHLGFYQGRETPEFFTQAANVNLDTDGQRFKIRHDWAAEPVGYWGLYKVDDTTND